MTSPIPENAALARKAGLHYVNDDDPGITRKLSGDGFAYTGPAGRAVKDAKTLKRIAALAIPPAYTDVWISADPLGHIQATGRDARGRKQYRYHADWHAFQGNAKFAAMAEFGRALPNVRAALKRDLAKRDLSRPRVLATIVRLLEQTLVRVGNDEYARTNKSFGLTTLRNRHLKPDGAAVRLDFKGKSGIRHNVRIGDRRVLTVIRKLHDLPGQRLFQYVGEDGETHQLGSSDVNDYLREISGADITAKDFRTWAATLAAARSLAVADPPLSDAEAKRAIVSTVKDTAGLLRNTPTVCRAAYIHPGVFSGWRAGALAGKFGGDLGKDERALIGFLESV
ncbi:DNA topoisomerase [Polymorphobacter glacialis]|uniref:DNA topoisomerase n=1 Tax=Sandarakinorhabdus glacialis TaxID=1614636 RepID=A0A917E4Y2_9SPHN|nr:DNA topoisomerase IB [Polymorphobacter glacialis]GGE01727.1 DNA topoisomerase [Polymorphobacter glacialis]